MPEFFVNGQPVSAEPGQTVLSAALAAGFFIPYFCWHPQLSTAGNCRMCMVEVEGQGLDIACNMPVSAGMKVLTDSPAVAERRKEILQLILLNHPVDCGVCDKAGECSLQDYHYEFNGELSTSIEPKLEASKFYPLSDRIVLDNERCILCTRCVRFTREVSLSYGLGIDARGDHSLIRPSEDGAFAADPYSDNVIDLCPVGALLSRPNLYRSRVWYLQATPQVCPGCARGCNVDVWHRQRDWKLHAVDTRRNTEITRITPRDNPAVNGPWICNVGRDAARFFERPRALAPLLKGQPVAAETALAELTRLVERSQRPYALVSSAASNEELAAFKHALGGRMTCRVKSDRVAEAGEVIEDDFLIRADKNPNSFGAHALFGDAPAEPPADCDLLLVWGEGWDFSRTPRGAKLILLSSFLAPANGHAEVFLPLSLQTERSGHFSNFAGEVSAFEACFAKPAGVLDATTVFERLEFRAEARP